MLVFGVITHFGCSSAMLSCSVESYFDGNDSLKIHVSRSILLHLNLEKAPS